MNDVDKNAIALMVLNKQLEDDLKVLGEALKNLGSINQMLELENEQLKNKLEQIERIVKNELRPLSLDEMSNAEIQIKKY